jgi:threonine dehydrogenase-like Zn-dependent dehydrogenase
MKVKIARVGICGGDWPKLEASENPRIARGHEAVGYLVEGNNAGQRVILYNFFEEQPRSRSKCLGSDITGALGADAEGCLDIPEHHLIPTSLDERLCILVEPLACIIHALCGIRRYKIEGSGAIAKLAEVYREDDDVNAQHGVILFSGSTERFEQTINDAEDNAEIIVLSIPRTPVTIEPKQWLTLIKKQLVLRFSWCSTMENFRQAIEFIQTYPNPQRLHDLIRWTGPEKIGRLPSDAKVGVVMAGASSCES